MSRLYRLMVLAIAIPFSVAVAYGQNQPLNPESRPDSVRLKIVYPVDGDTLNFDRIRYAGSAIATATVSVQGKETRVYRSGAFVGRVDLKPGHNLVEFMSTDKFGTISDTLRIFREPSLAPLPERPTRIRTERIMPSQDVRIIPGDELEVRFLGSPGGQATFSLDKIAKDVPMTELPAREAQNTPGWYQGSILLPMAPKYKPKFVEFKFRGKDGRKLKFKSAGRVHLLSPIIPLVGVTKDSSNLVLTGPDGEVWMELPSGVKMQIIGEQAGFTKVKLADSVKRYIATAKIEQLPTGQKLPFASVGSIGTLRQGNWLQLRINLSEKVPFRIDQMVDPAALEITFFRAYQAPHWITYPPDDQTVKLIKWRQEDGENFVLQIDLNQKQQWGYWGRYVGDQFRLNIRQTPKLSLAPDSLLKGLVITVDPGHGGEFEGAVSPTGLFEKTVNLKYAMLVADLLEAEGASVVRTRTSDTTMTLQRRIHLATQAESHIFISLHNNSIGAATNPMRPRGTSTYYTIPQSQAITRSVYKRLLTLGLRPFGMVSSTYFVTRQTRFLSFIVEGAFMTHPEDEMLLLDDTFLTKLAQGVVDGVKDFVYNTMAEKPSNGVGSVRP